MATIKRAANWNLNRPKSDINDGFYESKHMVWINLIFNTVREFWKWSSWHFVSVAHSRFGGNGKSFKPWARLKENDSLINLVP